MFDKVLLACDGSETARRAIDYTVNLMRALPNGAVTVLSVAPVYQDLHDTSSGLFEPAINGPFQAELRDIAEGWADAAVARFQDAGIQVEKAVSAGDAGAEIARFAEAGGFDHIITGSHGRTGLRAVLLGSVVRKVLHFAHCPVIVVRGA